MSVDLKTLMSQDKKALAQSVHNLGGKVKRFSKTLGNPARDLGENVLDLVTNAVGAGGLGLYIGNRQGKLDNDDTKTNEEKEFGPELWGMSQDWIIAGGLVAVGLAGQLKVGRKMLGPKVTGLASGLGIGALSYVVGSYAEKMAYDKETGE